MSIRLTSTLIALLASLVVGRVEGAPVPTQGLAPEFVASSAPAAKVKRDGFKVRLGAHRLTKGSCQADDELGLPDAPEDAIPDDKGDADGPDSRPSLFIGWVDSLGSDLLALTQSSVLDQLSSLWQGPPRYLSLCRLMC